MIPLKILNKQEKAEIVKKLNEDFGITNVPGMILMRGRERLFLFSGDLDEKKLRKIERLVPIERVGVYFAKILENREGQKEIKLSLEGVQALAGQIKKNTFSLNEKEAEEWMHGRDLQIQTGKYGFLAIKHGNDFLGSGKASEDKIGNFIPKSRRLKNKGN